MSTNLLACVLAAGQGTRFKSERIKVLHPLLGRPMVRLVVDTVRALRPEKVYVVVGFQKNLVMKEKFPPSVEFVVQRKQLGTAHAVLAARKVLQKQPEKDLLIINGDLALIRPETLRPMVRQHRREGNALTFLTAEMEDPTGFGRVVPEAGGLIRIIEEREASAAVKRIRTANVGVYCFKIRDLLRALPKISNDNRKREYYLTDIIEILSGEGKKVGMCPAPSDQEIVGINDRFELAKAVEVLRMRRAKALAESGVTLLDPASTWVDLDVKVGQDTTLHASVILEGKTRIGRRCTLYPFVHVVDSRVGDDVTLFTSTMIEGSRVDPRAHVGPFAHLRPGSVIMAGARVGNFVEMKKTVFGKGSKAGHLSYLGDSEIGDKVNIGAGTITCNYDGRAKHKTFIDSGAFVGSGTELVAPVKVGKRAYVGAGSTITKDVPSDALAVARSRQVERRGWRRKKRKK
ncbi:MAG: bifunctional UDP-N-acetylglucosamine diphosphorylase/glucosamine-1-phosphate N-acetyltransferase GlmU [Candidatus Aminicenantales bacterium]